MRPFFANEELEEHKRLIIMQLLSIGVLALAGVFVWVVHVISPTFFRHPNLTWGVKLSGIAYFWPLFLYAAAMATRSSIGATSDGADGKNFVLGAVSSILAGVWEEIGFRWLFICTAMVGLAFSNWMLGSFFGSILGIISFVAGFFLIFSGAKEKQLQKMFGGIIFLLVGGLLLYGIWWLDFKDPVYWFHAHIVVPVVNFVTLGFFKDVIKNPVLPPLLVFGMIAANAKFRDGHKYQGSTGMLNAWIIGFIMMHATIVYGIGTAIALHAVYDLEFDFVRLAMRKTFGRN